LCIDLVQRLQDRAALRQPGIGRRGRLLWRSRLALVLGGGLCWRWRSGRRRQTLCRLPLCRLALRWLALRWLPLWRLARRRLSRRRLAWSRLSRRRLTRSLRTSRRRSLRLLAGGLRGR